MSEDNILLKAKDPLIHFPFYINQYHGLLSRFSFEERGAFISVLCVFLSEDGDLPQDKTELFRICLAFTDSEKAAVLKVLERSIALGREIIPYQKAKRQQCREAAKVGGKANAKRTPKHPLKRKFSERLSKRSSECSSDTETDTNTKTELKKYNKSNLVDDFHLSIANQLADHIQSKKQISIGEAKRKSWAKEISLLERKDLKERNSSFNDINNALEAIKEYDGTDKFFPTIESGSSFRSKFQKIENFVSRNHLNQANKDQFTSNVSNSLSAINEAINEVRLENGF